MLKNYILILFLFCSSVISAQQKGKKTPKKTLAKKEIKKESKLQGSEYTAKPIVEEEAPETNPLKIKYRRSSLYTLMLETPNLPFADSIKKYFVGSNIPDKFNNHNLKNRVITKLPVAANATQAIANVRSTSGVNALSLVAGNISTANPGGGDSFTRAIDFSQAQTPYVKEYYAERKRLEEEAKEIGVTKKSKIQAYIDKRVTWDSKRYEKEVYESLTPEQKENLKKIQSQNTDIARELVAKWFNRSPKGGFDMSLIKARGNYDASVLDIARAKASKKGMVMLEDAGEDLIKNTFVLINEFKYVNKEEVASGISTGLNILAQAAAYVPGGSTVSSVASLTSAGVTVAGKGYVVKTKGHLYKLDWNEEVANRFYNEFWTTDKTVTAEKRKAFDETDIFKLVYVGTDDSWADVQSTIFTSKTDVKLVERATIKAMDAVIVKLQKANDIFKTRTPLFTAAPVTAKIGLKEGLTKNSVFDVFEQQVDENGKVNYVDVATIKVDSNYPIWDNRYGATEEVGQQQADRTYFKKISGRELQPGMLIVQKRGK